MNKKLIFTTIAIMAVLGACSKPKTEDAATAPAAPTNTAATPAANTPAATPAAPATADASAATPAADAAALAALPAPFNKADLKNGEKQFALCKACHTIKQGGPNGVGPNMYGLIGRKAGTAANFSYSDAMKNSGKVWDVATIDTYLQNPKAFVPGNKMPFAGVPNEKNRHDVIAYIAVTSKK